MPTEKPENENADTEGARIVKLQEEIDKLQYRIKILRRSLRGGQSSK